MIINFGDFFLPKLVRLRLTNGIFLETRRVGIQHMIKLAKISLDQRPSYPLIGH